MVTKILSSIFGQGLALFPSLELDADLIKYPTLEILRQTGGGLSIFTSWNHNLPTYKGFQLSGMLMPTSHLKNFLNASPLLTLKTYAIWLLHLGSSLTLLSSTMTPCHNECAFISLLTLLAHVLLKVSFALCDMSSCALLFLLTKN